MREVAEDPGRPGTRRAGRAAVAERQSVERAAAFVAEPHAGARAHRPRARDARDGRDARGRISRRGPEPLLGRAVTLGARRPALPRGCCCGCCARISSASASSRRCCRSGSRTSNARATGSRTRCASSRGSLGDTDRRFDGLDAELYPEPYVAEEAEAGQDSPYASFEDVFRGPEERVRELLEPYVELLRGHAPVLDVGCGRGELLSLLREAGVEARGVDTDEGMVKRARRLGLDVEHDDGIAYLDRLEPASLGAVTAIHVIEHLPYEQLKRLFAAARTALRPGGLLVAETINPHSLSAFKTFWVDPTHRGPVFPEVARTLALIHGFGSAEIIHPRAAATAARPPSTRSSLRPRPALRPVVYGVGAGKRLVPPVQARPRDTARRARAGRRSRRGTPRARA